MWKRMENILLKGVLYEGNYYPSRMRGTQSY